ncbi:MAG: hypothetical protein H6822_25485 [Planctomycetaceae bacterium]|nr:hypothetical protein [Planctomycetaceae bacterium]
MREKFGPWLPVIFCASLSLITIVANLAAYSMTGVSSTGSGDMTFYCFMPMCFFFVGAYLSQLKKANQELRHRIDELAAKADVAGTAA